MHMHREKATWEHSEKAANYKAKREALREAKPTNIFILDFEPP